MTRKEWVEKNLPAYIDDHADCGVIGCPSRYSELRRIDPSVLTNRPCKGRHEVTRFMCNLCWDTELNVKEERKETMTRKEWVEQHYPDNVKDSFIGGILGCPYKYLELCKLDPKIKETMICPGIRRGSGSGIAKCDECWNTPLPDEGVRPSNKVEIRKTMGEPHIKDVFYTIVRYPIGQYWLYLVGEFSVVSMNAINDTMVKCVSFDYDFQYEYTFFYDLANKVVSLTPDIQYQAKSTPNLDRSLFLERRDAIEALEKWTGNIFDRRRYALVQKGESK